MTDKLHYLAYGSNLHPLRLQERVPSASAIGVVEIDQWQLSFQKRSKDLSGKCNIHFTGQIEHRVHGVLYSMKQSEKILLDEIEGSGFGYDQTILEVTFERQVYRPFVYIADDDHIDPDILPYDWYKGFVLAGAHFHQLPRDYVTQLAGQPAKADVDPGRAADNHQRLTNMHHINRSRSSG